MCVIDTFCVVCLHRACWWRTCRAECFRLISLLPMRRVHLHSVRVILFELIYTARSDDSSLQQMAANKQHTTLLHTNSYIINRSNDCELKLNLYNAVIVQSCQFPLFAFYSCECKCSPLFTRLTRLFYCSIIAVIAVRSVNSRMNRGTAVVVVVVAISISQ